ncbi:metallophosphoesterase [Oscillatoria sp. FACHB-1406]|uniref:metallophosphoesterase n=1 Tax=Oscillatoria sp. FACHB-1406 TaxID=2692846 RepID=UPI0016860E8A|nr:metallophosphoesterase [Oscillatoria sp. FACHB-1406]MBD2576382.1 metallophosphoesterase [Oscillatoria sp. FACHB-1406]
MSLKRRQFLGLSALGGLSLALGSHFLAKAPSPHETADAREPVSLSPASNLPLLRFVSVGDTGSGAEDQYAVGRAIAQYREQNPFPFVLLAGDNIYTNGEIEKIEAVFERPYESLLANGVKFYATLGNHDIRTENGDLQIEYPGFNMGGRYYTFRKEDVQFFVLDTNQFYVPDASNNPAGDAQLAWLELELERSTAPWKVVLGHHQIYSSGHYGVNQAFVAKFSPLFEKYGVQVYINGHEHHYERSNAIAGTTYIICGGGGAYLRPLEARQEFSAYAESRFSFVTYEVYRDRMVIKGLGTDGQVFDEGSIALKAV